MSGEHRIHEPLAQLRSVLHEANVDLSLVSDCL